MRRSIEARIHLDFCAEVYNLQLRGGRHFLHEHPAGATSWKEASVQLLASHPRVGTTIGDMCAYGLTTSSPDGECQIPVLKPTRWLSSSPALLKRLSQRCRHDHRHGHLQGRTRTQLSAIYTRRLCKEIIKGIHDQRMQEVGPLQKMLDIAERERERDAPSIVLTGVRSVTV